MIASSILKARGFHNIVEIEGGFDEILKTTLPTQATAGEACSMNN
jgi:rhodanese-related sulfurtransferase